MKRSSLIPRFVDTIPDHLEDGILYISQKYGVAIHRCCCGCGEEVVTPLTPADWRLHVEGNLVSLTPSIGNWNFRCRAHYWIRRDRVEWAGNFSSRQVRRVQEADRRDKERYVAAVNEQRTVAEGGTVCRIVSLLEWLKRLWNGA